MYKTRLQELCQSRKWPLPDYCTVKEGPQHQLRFLATVSVKGQNFATPSYCRSGKEAENTAAEIAYQHLYSSVPQYVHDQDVNPNLPIADPILVPTGQITARLQEMQLVSGATLQVVSPPPSGLPMPRIIGEKNDVHPNKPNNAEPVHQIFQETAQKSAVNSGSVDFHCKKEMLHIYKNLLQEYAQKKILGLPIYTCEAEGPPHARRFRSKVSLDGKSYGTLDFFLALKEAEQAAAKVACQELLLVNQAQEDGCSYKSLLQEFAQKKGLVCPSYETSTYGVSHMPVFVSTVDVGPNTFRGTEAKTKKQAETNAAKVAYCTLIGDCRATESSKVSSGNQSAVVDNVTPAIKQSTTTEKQNNSEGPSHVNLSSSNPHFPSDGVDNPASVDPIDVQRAKNMYSSNRTAILPRKTSLPVPNYLSVLPISDGQWVAYKT